jgi:hybrid cluster-associated redox disulfide protein
MAIEADMTVDDIMRRWPATIRVFLDYKMACVGCPIATFHTVDDACREHNVNRDVFLVALAEAVSKAKVVTDLI